MDIQGPFSYPWTKDTTYPWTALHLSTLPMDKLELPNPLAPHGQHVLRPPMDNMSSGSPWTTCPQDPLDKSLIAQPLGQISLIQPMDSKKIYPWTNVTNPLDIRCLPPGQKCFPPGQNES